MKDEFFLVLKPVSNEHEVEQLRNIRNTCKDFMTRNTQEIDAESQLKWWKNLDKKTNFPYLLFKVEHGVVCVTVGYGYVRIEDNQVLLTGGLLPVDRNMGHGKKLFEMMISSSKKFNLPIRIEVLNTNTTAYEMYKKIGFKIISADDRITKMEYYYDSVI